MILGNKHISRMLCWFSCGAASAVAAKVCVEHYAEEYDVEVCYCDTMADEHQDNHRFFDEVQEWLGVDIKVLKSDKYQRINDVFLGERFIVGQAGAPCTRILKQAVRIDYQRPGDVHVLGYTSDEAKRALRFEKHHQDLDVEWVLINRGIAKSDCHHLLDRAGIEQPAMYRMGYLNNNCIGCVKGGMGYWNKIRRDFPKRFAEMAKIEREIGHAINSKEKRESGRRVKLPVYLDELDPNAGREDSLDIGECGVFCNARINRLATTIGE